MKDYTLRIPLQLKENQLAKIKKYIVFGSSIMAIVMAGLLIPFNVLFVAISGGLVLFAIFKANKAVNDIGKLDLTNDNLDIDLDEWEDELNNRAFTK